MKKILALAFAALLSISLSAQKYKVLERSAKSAPQWIGGVENEFIISSATESALNTCQQDVLTDIRQRIAMAIATNIRSTQTSTLQSVTNNSGTAESDVFKSESRMIAAKMPFLSGITLANATDSYWEKRKDKETKAISYFLTVKYPCSNSYLSSLIAQFEAINKEKEAQLQEIRDKADNIESVSDIQQGLVKLRALKEFFIDDVHIADVNAVIQIYSGLLSNLSVGTTINGNGSCFVQLLLDGKPIISGVAPKVKGTDCISAIDVKHQDNGYLVTYEDEDCRETDETSLTISFNCPGKIVKKVLPLTKKNGGASDRSVFSVIPKGTIYLQAASCNTTSVTDITIRMTLDNRGGTPFELKSIELNVPELAAPIIFDEANVVYNTKGAIQVKGLVKGTFRGRIKEKPEIAFVRGVVTVVNPKTNTVETLRLYLPYQTNWDE